MHTHTKPVRQELSDYDESLLLDRSYVHIPPDGCASRNLQPLRRPATAPAMTCD